jgi:hypothetical protein
MHKSTVSFAFATLALLVIGSHSPAAEPPHGPVQDLMQAKLRESQSLLGSVSTGDFTAMSASARRLVELGQLTSWFSSQTPREQLLLEAFRRPAEALVKAADKKNLDAASLAYVQLTLACFDCHKNLRETRMATLPNFAPPTVVATR